MFLGFNSPSHPGRAPAIVLAAAGFALGILAATTIRPAGQADVTTAAPVLAPTLPAQPIARDPPPGIAAGYPADVIRVLDGDTFEARVRVWPGLEITTKVRLRGIDAPELRARCAEERMQAEIARSALSSLLAQGRIGITQVSLDKYGGRVIAAAATRLTPDVAEALLAGGHVRRYGGGRRESWCTGRPF